LAAKPWRNASLAVSHVPPGESWSRNARVDRKADSPLLVCGDPAGDHVLDVVGVMDRFEPCPWHDVRDMYRHRNAAVAKRIHHQRILIVAEGAFAFRRDDIVGMMDDVQHARRC
jgi:hypothetical protein